MKRTVLVVVLGALLLGTMTAQAGNPSRQDRRTPKEAPGDGPEFRGRPEALTITGTLEAANGRPALKDGDTAYSVMGIDGLIGFVDGLKEGAQVSLTGFASPGPRNDAFRVLWVSKLTFNGKDYEIARPQFALGPGALSRPDVPRTDFRGARRRGNNSPCSGCGRW
ncbi:MAG: hypothetical protein LBS97_01115 [Treponema sp.]|jgi:hypothetical protein|nr:hypothetical protein [Treponema sp.]